MKSLICMLADAVLCVSAISCGNDNGARERGAILEHPAMKEAYDMGRNV